MFNKVSTFAAWVNDDYVMSISGEMRESVVFGENLVLKRNITAKLFENKITIKDTIINEGFIEEDIALCYHCNFGYPLVKEGSKILNVPDDIAEISGPIHLKTEECIPVKYDSEIITTGIKNDSITVLLTYNRKTLPEFLIWRMLGESEYVIGLEPRTTNNGGRKIAERNEYVSLKPFVEYNTMLEIEVKENKR
jgi:hypothetical protein